MFTAMGNIVTSHMMDRELFPFQTIKATGAPVADGDIAFDEDEQCGTPAPATGVVKLVRPGQAPAPLDDAGEAYSAADD
jgi:tRNA 2-thiocytidine biosynthesis protein TtcA